MRRSILTLGLAAGLLVLGGCATSSDNLSLAEFTSRCEGRGGELKATGASTGLARQDYRCSGQERSIDRQGFLLEADVTGDK